MRFRGSPAAWAALAALAAVVTLFCATRATAQQTIPTQRIDVFVPEDTGDGVWDGTYVYSCRDFKIGLWMRTRDGKPEMKLRYQSLQAPETFETDWNTKATYYLSGQPATFGVTYASRDARRIEAAWHWDVQFADSGRTNDSTFSVFRPAGGRALVFRFRQVDQQIRGREEVKRFSINPPPVWTFSKVSKRIDVLWEELPF